MLNVLIRDYGRARDTTNTKPDFVDVINVEYLNIIPAQNSL